MRTLRLSVVTTALLGVAVVVAPVAGPRLAHAQRNPGAAIKKRLARGKALFDDLEYKKAIEVLAPIPRADAATRAQRLAALELIGLSRLILGHEAAARDAFEQLLTIDSGYQLRDDTGSPKIRNFFDEVKRTFVPGFDADAVAELEHAAPEGAAAGRRLDIEVRAVRGAVEVKEVVVFWRRRGVLDYHQARARRVDGDRRGERWRARFEPPASERRYVLEYYVEARNIAGGGIARVAGPETPLSLPVSAGGERDERRWRWYVVAGAAAVGVIGSALLITSRDGTPDGTLPPERITLTPR